MSEDINKKKEQLKAIEEMLSNEIDKGTYLEKLINDNKGSNMILNGVGAVSKTSIAKEIAKKQGIEYLDITNEEGLKKYQEMMKNDPDKKVMLNFNGNNFIKKKEVMKKKENNIEFTIGQVKDILEEMNFDELPFNSNMDLGIKLKIFNHMPQTLQGECIMWGSNDTEVRTNISKWMCEKQLGITLDEWYDSGKCKEYFYSDSIDNDIEIDFKKFYV